MWFNNESGQSPSQPRVETWVKGSRQLIDDEALVASQSASIALLLPLNSHLLSIPYPFRLSPVRDALDKYVEIENDLRGMEEKSFDNSSNLRKLDEDESAIQLTPQRLSHT